MEKNRVQEMIDIFKKSGLAKMEYSEENAGKSFAIYLEAAIDANVEKQVIEHVVEKVTPVVMESTTPKTGIAFNHTATSPMIGVFYAAASPTAAPFVTVGSKVKKGDVICIIEAMKLMNEITAEHDGTIVEVCVKNGDLVEFGQELFKIL